MTKRGKVLIASISGVALIYAAVAFERRWMSDDGLIFVRTVRQILEGNGPVFNAFERAEACTSTLWTYLLVALSAITRSNPAYVAVFAGLVLSIASLVIGMWATAQLHRARTALLVPGGVLVIVAVFPFWDFATSGLETGLSFAWLAASWWLLVTLTPQRLLASAVVWGLGPLVRPDFGIVSIVMMVAAWLLERPPWKRTLALGAAAIALPFVYEIFRAGYYGALVPLPALAKSATSSEWARGFVYLLDYAKPYWLWVPFALLGGLLGFVALRGQATRRERIIIGAPIVAGLIMTLYVLRVGGDFMHARMFLPATFMLLLPSFLLPWQRITAPVIGVLVVWGVGVVIAVADGESHISYYPIEDERHGYVRWTGRENPIHPKVFVLADMPASGHARNAVRYKKRVVLSEDTMLWFPMSPRLDGPAVFVAGRLGTGGAIMPVDSITVDTLGLANPLGARITPTLPDYPGHEKPLPIPWIVADFGAPDASTRQAPPIYVRAARNAMQCGELAELLESVRAPLTASRFWANLTGSFRRTRLVIPSDAVLAEHVFCGDNAQTIAVRTSSSHEFNGWHAMNAVDGIREVGAEARGFSTGGSPFPTMLAGSEWIELTFPKPRRISKVLLYPASELFPIDFTIQIWDGSRWIDRVTQRDYKLPDRSPQTFSWATPDTTNKLRIVATELPQDHLTYWMQFAEIETAE